MPCYPRLFSLLVVLTASVFAQNTLTGTVEDAAGAVIPGASVRVRNAHNDFVTASDGAGNFRFTKVAPGDYSLSVAFEGFATATVRASVPGEPVRVRLAPARVADHVDVFGSRIAVDELAQRMSGSVDVISRETLERSHARDFSEALRKSPGLNVREEEGFGLRPNIGIRGLNPTRSSKVLLLEDGVPLAYSVYGDNASYYHPPVERFDSIEIVKGAGQILYGPSTVGGVVNYVTPAPPAQKVSGALTMTGGNRNYFNGAARVGGTLDKTGWLLDYMRKQGQGSRESIRSGLNDLTLKATQTLGGNQFVLKGNLYTEDSNVAYSGLRLSEFLANPRQNPFKNDFFAGRRHGVSLQHVVPAGTKVLLSTSIYGAVFTRDWWRQSSNSSQRPNDAGDPACGGMANLNTTCGNEGRLRQYHTAGAEPHARVFWNFFGLRNETDLGFRAHFEKQYRLQINGPLPTSRSGVTVENNIRREQAYSTFIQNKFSWGRFAITPGVRIEHIDYTRNNRLLAGAVGRNDLTQAVPGVGMSYAPLAALTIFGGVHRGFSPPRTEDVITNLGGAVQLDPELSWNYEAGFRAQIVRGVRVNGTFFRMDYENQIVPASLAGGIGATLTNGGQTLHQGFELGGRLDSASIFGTRYNFFATGAYTSLPTARFAGLRRSNIPGFTNVVVTGNRLPYAPENTMTGSFGYAHTRGFDVALEAVFVGDQFGDDLNTVASSADGQRGLLPSNTTWNAVANYRVEEWRSNFFLAVKNLADSTFIVDRARGILPNNPRTIQAGLKVSF